MCALKLAISGENLGHTDDLGLICSVLQSHDVRYLELWPQNCEPIGGKATHPRTYQHRDLERAKAVLQEYNIAVCCVSFPGALDQELAKDSRNFALELERTVEVARFFGAGLVNTYCHLVSQSDQVDPSVLERYYRRGIVRAQEMGVVIALENEAHDMVRTPERMRRAIRHCNSPYFKTNFDATNYYQSSCEAYPQGYEILKRDIAYVHIKNGRLYDERFCKQKEWLGGELSGMHSPGNIYYTLAEEGSVNICGLLLSLHRGGYRGYCTLEPHTTREEILKYYGPELAYLRKIPVFE